jgi:hypothetical protein
LQDDEILSVGGGITVEETDEAIQGAQDEPITGYVIADDDDERGGADPDAPEGSAASGELTPRQQQRRQQKARRNFTRQKVDTLEKTVEQLQAELHALRQGGMATQATLIDNEIARLKSLESGWGSEYERAFENNDGAQARIALDYQSKAASAVANLMAQKQQLITQAQQVAAAPVGTGDVKRVVTAFADANPWFDPRQDEKSNKLARIGETLERMGLNPASEEYWDELSLRAERKGIEFVSPFAGVGDDDDDDQPQQPVNRRAVPPPAPARKPNGLAPTGGRGDAATAGGGTNAGGTFTFTKAHLEQLRLAGVDTSNRAEMTKWAGIFKKSARG